MHTPAPDLEQPGTLAAYAAIARRARFGGSIDAADALDSAAQLSRFRGDLFERRGAYLAATAMGAVTIGVIGGAFALAAQYASGNGGATATSINVNLPVAASPFIVAALTMVAWRHFFVVRRRLHAAITPLLELGLCPSCGQALRGASVVEGSETGVGEFADTPLCACAECGARWPVGASQAPFQPDGTSLGTAFPTVEGPARWRSRRALTRALRAIREDFTVDAVDQQRYIATGTGRSGGSSSIAADLAVDCGRAARYSITPIIGGMVCMTLFGMLWVVLVAVVGVGTQMRPVADFITFVALVYVAVVGFDTSRRRSRARRVRKAVRAALESETCPTCTNRLVRIPGATRYEPCTCCGATWRRT